ncbi:MAG: cytochrome C oxidase Cbb3, partial [Gordonibacter sp.]
MPTVRQNISYVYQRFMRGHRPAVKHLAKWILSLLAVALLLEVFLFNINYFTSAGYNTVNLNSKLNLQETADEQYKLTAVNHTLEFSNVNAAVHNIWLNFDYRQPAQELTVKIQFTDDAHRTYFDSTEYTVGVPNVNVSTLSDQSEYINLNTTGLVSNLRIEVAGDDVSYPIKLSDIAINARHPFDFNTTRFVVTAGILLLAFAFRPRSAIYRIGIVAEPRKSKAVIIATVIIEVWLMATFLFMGSNLVGVAAKDYNSGSWNGQGLANTFEVGGDNAQQYAELAKAMADGRLYLGEEPPQWLKDMPDPYDKGARDEAQKATGEPYLFDVAYHDGHYYVYFGVVPVLLFYLPFYLLTGASFPTAIGVLIACVAFVLGCSALLDRFARYHFKRVSLGLYL